MKGTVLITGGNRGIGLALVGEFIRREWRVCAAARNPDVPELAALSKISPGLLCTKLDVLNSDSIRAAAGEIAAKWGQLDVLINNAAIFPGEGDERFEDLNLDWFGEAFDCNVVGVARVTREFLPLLRKGASPRIVNISSGAGSIAEKADSNYYPYSVSKAALNMLTRAMAAEFQHEGMTVVSISPGWVKTEMGGPHAQITPEESAKSLCATISGLTLTQTGLFMGRDGNTTEYPW